MNADELKKLTTESLDHLSAALAEGHSERLSALLKTMAQFHRYSFHNVCLITRQRPDATRVAGFHAWQKLGRLTAELTKRLRALPTVEQVAEVLELEKQGVLFSKDFSKSILYSIAAPGTPLAFA